jgi:hypothetical protein
LSDEGDRDRASDDADQDEHYNHLDERNSFATGMAGSQCQLRVSPGHGGHGIIDR